MTGVKRLRRHNRRPWVAALLGLLALAGLAAAAGHGYYHGGAVDIKPRFDQPWQRIRYHDTFHDGHSHDGYGHGYHDSNAGHVHDEAGDAVARDPMVVVGPQGVVSPVPPRPGYAPPFAAQVPDTSTLGPELGEMVGGLVAGLVQGVVEELEALPDVSSVDITSAVSANGEVAP